MNDHKKHSDYYGFQTIQIVITAVLGICIAFLIALLAVNTLSVTQTISVYCFSVAIPCLTFTWLLNHQLKMLTEKFNLQKGLELSTNAMSGVRSLMTWFSRIGYTTAFIGIVSMFFHFSKMAGFIFIIAGVGSFLSYLKYGIEIRRELRYAAEMWGNDDDLENEERGMDKPQRKKVKTNRRSRRTAASRH